MIYKLVMWLIGRMSVGEKKAIVLGVLQEVVHSKTSTIDPEFAEAVMVQVVKSRGNNVTAYLVKE